MDCARRGVLGQGSAVGSRHGDTGSGQHKARLGRGTGNGRCTLDVRARVHGTEGGSQQGRGSGGAQGSATAGFRALDAGHWSSGQMYGVV